MENNNTANDGFIVANTEDIDPKELADRIKKRVQTKISSGFYDEKEIERVARFKAQIPEEIENNHQDILRRLEATWRVTQPVDLQTHRGGVSGKIVKLVKKLYQVFVHRFIKFSFVRQELFNQGIRVAAEEIYYLRSRYIAMSQRLASLERVADEADRRSRAVEKDLRDNVRTLSGTLKDIDKQGIFLKRRLDVLLDKLRSGEDKNVAKIAETEKSKLDSFDYTLFESVHRGSRSEIKDRLQVYAQWFKGALGVLDVGCGRGELLEIFKENGIEATGVDMNDEMVEECRRLGLSATEGDALSYLESMENGSLGGLCAIQFVEHLPVDVMTRFFELVFDKLRPGAVVAAETINAACLTTFCGAFYLDMSHVKPIHPLALQFLLERIGFEDVRIEYLNPYPDHIRLNPLPERPDIDKALTHEYNANVSKLNNVLYSHTDYAVVARR